MAFRFPYLSLDTETTGLDTSRVHILQLAAIYDNGGPLEELPTFNTVIRWSVFTYGEEYAMNLNKRLLEYAVNNKEVPQIEQVREDFSRWLKATIDTRWITLAGKNVGTFDYPVLKNDVNKFDVSRFRHRMLDPGSMFTEEFDHLPNQTELNKLVGRGEVAHDALSDCWDIIYSVRYKWGV